MVHVIITKGDPLNGAPSSPFITQGGKIVTKERPNILLFSKKNICLDFRRRDWWGLNSLSSHFHTHPCPLLIISEMCTKLHITYPSLTLVHFSTVSYFPFYFFIYIFLVCMCKSLHIPVHARSTRFSHRSRKSSWQRWWGQMALHCIWHGHMVF